MTRKKGAVLEENEASWGQVISALLIMVSQKD